MMVMLKGDAHIPDTSNDKVLEKRRESIPDPGKHWKKKKEALQTVDIKYNSMLCWSYK